MNNKQYKEFCKRYEKFKKNTLPTPFLDEERNTFEYVCYVKDDRPEVYYSLTDAMGDVAFTGFYYPFIYKHVESKLVDGKWIKKEVVGHSHGHSFDEVVRALYESPESFRLEKKDLEYYSKQELEYLDRVQKYLLFIGLKDIDGTHKIPQKRYQNKKHLKYSNAFIHTMSNANIKNIIKGKLNYTLINYYKHFDPDLFKPYQVIYTDEKGNMRVLVETTHEELKRINDMKEFTFKNKPKTNEKVVVIYFKVLEIFDK